MTRKAMALVVKPGSTVAELVEVPTDLDGLTAIVGGLLEAVTPSTADAGKWHAYVDEEGKYKGLPVNLFGTILAHSLGWTGREYLVGPMVFLGSSGADEADLPTETLDMITRVLTTFAMDLQTEKG